MATAAVKASPDDITRVAIESFDGCRTRVCGS